MCSKCPYNEREDSCVAEKNKDTLTVLKQLREERETLVRLLTTAKNDLLYMLLKQKANAGSINALGFAALYEMGRTIGRERLDSDFAEICSYLEKLSVSTEGEHA